MGRIYDSITFRPISAWPGGDIDPYRQRRSAPFRAPWGATIELLERELRMLEARNVVLEIAIKESDLRLDGKPRAQSKAAHPGVILSFGSKWGPLRYSTDEYRSYGENLRAIALAMEALRKVDRYGVSKRGEQYRGWRALGSGSESRSAARGRDLISEHGSVRAALMATHPDRGGDQDDFAAVQAAREEGAA